MFPPLGIAGDKVPVVRLAQRAPLDDRAWTVCYRHQGGHALHLHGYRGAWRCGNDEMPLSSGTATLSPQDVDTRYDLQEKGWHWVVHFTAVDGDLRIPTWCDLGSEAAYARSRLARITALHEQSRATPTAAIAAGAALLELLAWLAMRGTPRQQGSRVDAALDRVAALIREQPDRDWRAPALARRVGVSPNWLAARFRERFNMTIDRFRLTQRVELARLLLGSTALPVQAIGVRVGLPDAQHFNKVFRAIIGVPPSACRGDLARIPSTRRSIPTPD
jgi:AraC-like DNA-binding protein